MERWSEKGRLSEYKNCVYAIDTFLFMHVQLQTNGDTFI